MNKDNVDMLFFVILFYMLFVKWFIFVVFFNVVYFKIKIVEWIKFWNERKKFMMLVLYKSC